MIEPFCSIYTKFYRAFLREPEIEGAKPCLYYNNLGENFLPAEDSKAIYNPERDEALIKEMYVKRLASTYQVTYLASVGKKSLVIDPNNLDADQFMVNFNNYYAKRTQPVLRPLETARRINGYSRFDYYYTGLSLYEDTIGREGYNHFKKDYDLGKSRLFAKKQQELNKKNQPEGKKEKSEVKIEPKAMDSRASQNVKEKICGICCEKFGDFSSPPSQNFKQSEKSLSSRFFKN